ncbi:MAG: type II toxin-antitoxin system RelE/ParE family toxin [Clostridiales bacterium]|nr:type II toxin-antitoxin system RelE/ParE family toxin [Clostridiales bacterium]
MKTEYSVVYSQYAKEDLFSIYQYIAFDLVEPEVAEKQVNRIRNAVRKLSVFPLKHPAVEWEPWKSVGVRKLPVDNYVVYYHVNGVSKQISVVRIFYGGQDISRQFIDKDFLKK